MLAQLKQLLVLAIFCSTIALQADPTKNLFTAIESHDVQAAQQAISQGADINAHGTTSDTDFAATDWNPLMRSIAQLNSTIIKSQSYINTTFNLSKYLFGAGVALGGLASLYTGSWYPLAITAGISSLPLLFGHQVVKSFDADAIDNQFTITQSLLSHSKIDKNYSGRNAISASTIANNGYELLHSKDICPPAPALTPDNKYDAIMKTIVSQLPAPSLASSSAKDSNYFKQASEFKPVNKLEKLPIIFDANYDITFGGLENLHPFDTKKYGKVSKYILDKFALTRQQFYTPTSVTDQDLLLVHTQDYLNSLKSSLTLGLIADMPILGLLPNSFAQKALLDPVKLATGGTILGADLALEHGWAINLSGGYHHAKSTKPVNGGFCIINDICIAARKVLMKHPELRILIVDLDAHQGNGHEEVARNDKQIAIFDIYNGKTWPGDFACQERINFNFPVDGRKTNDIIYLKLLKDELPKAIDLVKPNMIIYNAGTDVYYQDPIGGMSLTKAGIIERDEVVFTQALSRNIPILMVLSGGYHSQSYAIISESVENLWNKLLASKMA